MNEKDVLGEAVVWWMVRRSEAEVAARRRVGR